MDEKKSLLQRIVEIFGSPYNFFRWLLVMFIMAFRIRGRTRRVMDKAVEKAAKDPELQKLDEVDRMQVALNIMGNVLRKLKEGRGYEDLEELVDSAVEEEKARVRAMSEAEISLDEAVKKKLAEAISRNDLDEVRELLRSSGHEYVSHEVSGIIARIRCRDGSCTVLLEEVERSAKEISESLAIDGRQVVVRVVKCSLPLDEEALRKAVRYFAKRQYKRMGEVLARAGLTLISHERTKDGGRIVCREGEIVLEKGETA